jgi:hypothetical protein
MRTSVQKPKAPQPTTPAKSTIPGRAPLGRNHDLNSILHLQRTVGNQTVQGLLGASARNVNGDSVTDNASVGHDFSQVPVHAHAQIQPKLTIGTPGDRSEQEADRAAEQVMQTPAPVVGTSEQREGSSRAIQRSGQTLSPQERSFFEPRFGHDFSQVRIHADARSAEMADSLNAEAFTFGRDIYFGAGKGRPQTAEADGLLAHELAHVVQQSHTGLALQPKLKITGNADHVARAIALLNANFGGFYYVSIDKSGEVKIEPVRPAHTSSATGPKPQQKALADRLWTVITDAKDVKMTVSAGSATLGGSFDTGDFDIADLETYGVGGLIHEIVEQHQKQAKGVKDFGTATTGAHGEATRAESEVTGLKRGADKVISMTENADGTIDAVIETPHTSPDGKVTTKVSTIKSNNIVSVTWK